MATKTTKKKDVIQDMFEAGAHYGYRKSRRHPSALRYIYGAKEGIELFNLEKTNERLDEVEAFVHSVISAGKKILFVSSKPEAKRVLETAADSVNQPHMTGRWIGGTITNFEQIKKRVERLHHLRSQRDKGELAKYTKKEQLLIDREIRALENKFGGIADMDKLPGALFVVDAREEDIAVREAGQADIPVIALCNTDCDFEAVDYPIPGNDASRRSIEYFVSQMTDFIEDAQKKVKTSDKETE